jgi:ubiquinone/menaquinone biosynthesis C-methylase UbiE
MEMRMFLRRSGPGRDPLPVAMSGVRAGERVLQVGVGEPGTSGALAAKVGINGHAAGVVLDEAAARRVVKSAEQAAALMEVHVASFDALPFDDASFDVVVVHNLDAFVGALAEDARATMVREWRRVLRQGGRVVVIEAGTRTGIGALLRPGPKPDAASEGGADTMAALKAGFTSARLLADREGYRFLEGLKK